MIKRCNDFGAGGVSVAIGELADSLEIDLDRVPKKYEGLDGTELAISESQERMAVALAPEDVDRFIELAHAENLEATPVAVVTDSGRVRMTWRGDTIVDVSREFLASNGAPKHMNVHVEEGGSYIIEVLVRYDIEPYVPAKISGPPEDCYPAEGGCVDELVAFKPGTSEIVELTAEERKEVRDWIELHHDHDADRRGDPDAAYEAWRDDQMDRRDDWGGEDW